jgi:hypothetical protein
MLNLSKTSAALLTVALTSTASLQAEEISLEQLVDNMTSQSVAIAQQELRYEIQGTVLTAANKFSLYEEATYATKTSITDLNTSIESTVNQQAE